MPRHHRRFRDTFAFLAGTAGAAFAVLSIVALRSSPQVALPLGLLFGVVFGLVVTPLVISVTRVIPVPPTSGGDLVASLDGQLAELGYGAPEHIAEDALGYAPANMHRVRCRYLSVRLAEHEIIVTGPRRVVSSLERRLLS
ncbi:hypothetical protein [Allokutzneria oryzae]|uniref:DUF3093 domain-containing protein n=1 Tax=Allokutzneria oryzae TaxID=1378989 RepID=A0ABV5ZSE8_9PSEU